MVIIGKAKQRHRKNTLKLSRPGWKIILKLSMMLVGYCTRSMPSTPLGGIESANGREDDVGCPLDNVGV